MQHLLLLGKGDAFLLLQCLQGLDGFNVGPGEFLAGPPHPNYHPCESSCSTHGSGLRPTHGMSGRSAIDFVASEIGKLVQFSSGVVHPPQTVLELLLVECTSRLLSQATKPIAHHYQVSLT